MLPAAGSQCGPARTALRLPRPSSGRRVLCGRMEWRPRRARARCAGRSAATTASATTVWIATATATNLNRCRLLQRSIGDREAGRQRLDRPIGDRNARRRRLDRTSGRCRSSIATAAPTAARLRNVGDPEQEHDQQSDACRQMMWARLINRHDILHKSGKFRNCAAGVCDLRHKSSECAGRNLVILVRRDVSSTAEG
jgi:hypothetical protein